MNGERRKYSPEELADLVARIRREPPAPRGGTPTASSTVYVLPREDVERAYADRILEPDSAATRLLCLQEPAE